MFKRLLLTLLATLALSTAANAYDFTDGDLYYDFNENGASVTVTWGDNGYSGVVTIPESVTYNGTDYSVTTIGNDAFSGCTGLTSIEIPNSVTTIGESAFGCCTGLTSIEIPNSVTTVGYDAFYECTGLTSIEIPNSVTSIGYGAFADCSGLTSIKVEAGNSVYDSRDNCNAIIETESNTLIAGCMYTFIHNSVTSIGKYAFSGCSGFIGVDIPNSITSIGFAAFAYCTGLNSISIGNSVTSIGGCAFQGCSGLTSIEIPNSVTSIGELAFQRCTGLTSVIWNAKSCNDYSSSYNAPFNNLSGIKSFIFGEEVEKIPSYLCDGLTGLTSVTIPNSVTSIGDNSFASCSGLTSIEIPNSLKLIGNSVFSDCTGLTSVIWNAKSCNVFWSSSYYAPFNYLIGITSFIFGEEVEKIPRYLCTGLTGLTSVTIPNSVTSIGDAAFAGCSGLTSFEIPNSVTTIDYSAFYRCSGLTSISIGNSVKSIGGYAFADCSGLSSVIWNAKSCNNFGSSDAPFSNLTGITSFIFGEDVEKIPSFLCSGLTGLTSVTIPNAVTYVGYGALNNCTGLTSVIWNAKSCNDFSSLSFAPFNNLSGIKSFTFGEEVEKIPSNLCGGLTGLTSVTIPNSVTTIGESAFYRCSGLTNVSIGNSVKSIGYSAFAYCSGLTSFKVDAGNSVYDSRDNCNAIIETETNILIAGCMNTIIPNSVTSIGKYAFIDCSGLTSIEIPNSVETIGGYAFYGCTGLTSIKVEAGNSVYDSRDNCNAIIETASNTLILGCINTIIPNSVTSIGDYAFYGCTGLTSIEIPNSVTSIGYGAFADCSGLTSIEIPNSVTSIGDYAFYGCIGLDTLTSHIVQPGNVDLGGMVFYRTPQTTCKLLVPTGSLSLYQSAPQWKDFQNIIEVVFPDDKPDVNGDGKTDIDDLNIVLNAILKNSDSVNYDVSGDGKVDIDDLNQVINAILNK